MQYVEPTALTQSMSTTLWCYHTANDLLPAWTITSSVPLFLLVGGLRDGPQDGHISTCRALVCLISKLECPISPFYRLK